MNIFLRQPCRLQRSFGHRLRWLTSTSMPENPQDPPVIRIPKYLETQLGKAIFKEHKKVADYKNKKDLKVKEKNIKYADKLILSWSGDKKLNHYYRYRYNPNNLQLISRHFLKETANGKTMTIHSFDDENQSLLEMMSEQDKKAKTFESLGLEPTMVKSIDQLVGKSIHPTSIQFGAIPMILKHENVILSAETGSGKTIAYLAPIIQMIHQYKQAKPDHPKRSPLGLVVLPSRELTEQVGYVARRLAEGTNVGVATMIGGLPKHTPHTGLDLVVSTLGLVDNHLNKNLYRINHLHHLVLDEADSLLDDSFSIDTMTLLESVNLRTKEDQELVRDNDVGGGAQLICASATMPSTLDSTIGTVMNLNNDIERITTSNLHCLHPNVEHTFYRINRYEKEVKLFELLRVDIKRKHPVVIFVNRNNSAYWLQKFLEENGIQCTKLTAEMDDEERAQTFRSFQDGEVDILVTTDLGSRGLDTIRVRHVINFDCPHFVSDYIHRAGRTGRLGSVGRCKVSSLVSFKQDAYMMIELETSLRLNQPLSPNANIKSQLAQNWADKRDKISRNFSKK